MPDSFCDPHGLYVALQAALSIGFPRQEYWGGLPFPSPGRPSRLRDRNQVSCTRRRVLYHCTTREARIFITNF